MLLLLNIGNIVNYWSHCKSDVRVCPKYSADSVSGKF